MVMVADLGAAHTAEKLFGPVGASAVEAVRLLVIDPLNLVTALRPHPRSCPWRRALAGTPSPWPSDCTQPEPNCRSARGPRPHLARAILIAEQATVAAVLFEVREFDVAAEIAIDFRDLAFPTDHAAVQFQRHRLAKLVQKYESALVRNVQVAGQRRLALDLIAVERDGREIADIWEARICDRGMTE